MYQPILACALGCFVVLVGGFKGDINFIWHCTPKSGDLRQIFTSHYGRAETCPALDTENVFVTNLTEDIDARTRAGHNIVNLVTREQPTCYSAAYKLLRGMNDERAGSSKHGIREWKILEQRVREDVNDSRLPDVSSWRCPIIDHRKLHGRASSWIEPGNEVWSDGNIGSQFSFRMSLSGIPQQVAGYEQSYGERGNDDGADGDDHLVILFHALSEAIPALLYVFLYMGPALALIVAAAGRIWLGSTIVSGWFLLVLSVLLSLR